MGSAREARVQVGATIFAGTPRKGVEKSFQDSLPALQPKLHREGKKLASRGKLDRILLGRHERSARSAEPLEIGRPIAVVIGKDTMALDARPEGLDRALEGLGIAYGTDELDGPTGEFREGKSGGHVPLFARIATRP